MRLIGILGTAHCGSTAMNLALGQLDGVAAVGESHWLESGGYPGRWPCRLHGFNCPTLTKLAPGSHDDWWGRIAKAYDKDVVVSSDKRPVFFDWFGHPDMAVILYREPMAWAHSWRYRNPDLDVSECADIWAGVYERCIAWAEKRSIPWRGVCWDDVRINPVGQMSKLAKWLELGKIPVYISKLEKPVCMMGGYEPAPIDRIEPADNSYRPGCYLEGFEPPPQVLEVMDRLVRS